MGAVAVEGAEGRYTVHPPRQHDSFDSYIVLFSPKFGVCRVTAIGKDIQTSSFGSALVAEYGSIESALNQKYGEGKKYDFLRAGSIWNEPRDYMMGLYKEERTLTTFWGGNGSTLDTTKTDGVTWINLVGKSLGIAKGYITLTYDFPSADSCIEELKAKKNSAL